MTKAPCTVTMTTEAETTVKANTTNATSTAASTTVKRAATEGNCSLKHVKRKKAWVIDGFYMTSPRPYWCTK